MGGDEMTFAQAFDLLKDGEAITYDDVMVIINMTDTIFGIIITMKIIT